MANHIKTNGGIGWRMVGGVVSGVAARTVGSPIDLLKIRFQIQPLDNPHYISIPSAIKEIARKEGVRAFWKGNVAGIYLYAVYNGVQFGVYGEWCKLLGGSHFLGGAMAAMTASVFSYPLDLIRTRHSLQQIRPIRPRSWSPTTPGKGTNASGYGSVYQTIRVIIWEEGWLGLYKGLGPSLLQLMPSMGISFATFDRSKKILSTHSHLPASLNDMLAGGISGFLSKAATMPFDVLRKRLQIQGSQYGSYVIKTLPIYEHGWRDAVRSIWRVEGLRGFYSGFTLALLKSIPTTATSFLVYGIFNKSTT